MKPGDLVRVNPRSISDYAKVNYPHMSEVGIVLELDVYHPIVLYSDGPHTMAKSNLEAINESR
jgi:hypothetical protein